MIAIIALVVLILALALHWYMHPNGVDPTPYEARRQDALRAMFGQQPVQRRNQFAIKPTAIEEPTTPTTAGNP